MNNIILIIILLFVTFLRVQYLFKDYHNSKYSIEFLKLKDNLFDYAFENLDLIYRDYDSLGETLYKAYNTLPRLEYHIFYYEIRNIQDSTNNEFVKKLCIKSIKTMDEYIENKNIFKFTYNKIFK